MSTACQPFHVYQFILRIPTFFSFFHHFQPFVFVNFKLTCLKVLEYAVHPFGQSGNTKTQIDFLLVRNRDQGLVTDAEIVPYETVATQHRLLICTIKIAPLSTRQIERCGPARIKWWRLKENEAAVTSRIRLPTVTTVEETWRGATEAMLDAARSELGTTKPGRRNVDRQS
ncbi:unnamed protein product [Heligmosomoides polygyrus]|uniref:CTP_transf_like domain-containing protein n=1 Tax=Heligmosomoides polygyrus TaxID=6339 RepID=A0A183G2P2_HELPZ|nr:unnamed protein product [Heligmosomoides polygyrus]